MNSLHFLLPLLVALPIIFDRLESRGVLSRLSFLNFTGPVLFFVLTLTSFLSKNSIQLTVYSFDEFFSVGLRLDVLSGIIAMTVSTIGLIVQRFVTRYLEDDPKKEAFKRNMALTISFVLAMLMAPNLILLLLSWIGTSFYIHKLLTHFNEREGAKKAAKQKFWVSRFGDLCIAIAAAIYLIVFKSLEFETIFSLAKNSLLLEENSLVLNLASLLLVIGAMTKSAIFPFHYWLPNTMETPTPVSAIMHAGIINAGGYLVIRMSPVLSSSPFALSLLAIVGSFTAFFATLIMFSQPNVKKNLAYSTIAQMGFMMLQCGLGAFSIAVVHIVGHAFYKAYAFLSSSSATDFGRLNRYYPKIKTSYSIWIPVLLAFTFIALTLLVMNMTGYGALENPGMTVLLVVLALAIAQVVLSSNNKIKVGCWALGFVGLYLCLNGGMTNLLNGIVPASISNDSFLGPFVLLVSSAFFVILYIIQNNLDRISETEFGKKVYVKALRGGF